METYAVAQSGLDSLDHVVADPIKLKAKLKIGEQAFTSLRLAKNLQTIWDVRGAGLAGAAAAASPAVATTFFSSTGGLLSMFGLGAAAATPVGWVFAAAVVSGGAYYGALRIFTSYSESRVEAIPKFISTPVDLLGATLFDMIAGIGLKVAEFAGDIEESERVATISYFSEEWGIAEEYSTRALPIIEAQIRETTLKDMVRSLAEFQAENPDCNPTKMKSDILSFLLEVAHADGDLDERETLAIEIVERELGLHLSTTAYLRRGTKRTAATIGNIGQTVTTRASKGIRGLFRWGRSMTEDSE